MKYTLHGKIENIWEKAVTPVALKEEILVTDTYKDCRKETDLSPFVTFSVKNRAHREEIRPTLISDRVLMNFIITICACAKKRSLLFFPVDDPNNWNQDLFPLLTRDIFADAISVLISVWLWIWDR
ncbi:MAG: hypothetical protein GY847_33270 [Proteobacteria bacterium]|nr:hypothetical protein [Pseudomonadota bacterium]